MPQFGQVRGQELEHLRLWGSSFSTSAASNQQEQQDTPASLASSAPAPTYYKDDHGDNSPEPQSSVYSLRAVNSGGVKATDSAPHHQKIIGSGGRYIRTVHMEKPGMKHATDPPPDRFELFLLGEGEKKVTWQFDTRTYSPSTLSMHTRYVPSLTLYTSQEYQIPQSLLSSKKTTLSAISLHHASTPTQPSPSPPTSSLTRSSPTSTCASRPMEVYRRKKRY